MSATRICPGCSERRILLPVEGGGALCITCRDRPQGRLFGLEATLEDLDMAGESVQVSLPERMAHAQGCRCDRPLRDGDGGCMRCGRWAAA